MLARHAWRRCMRQVAAVGCAALLSACGGGEGGNGPESGAGGLAIQVASTELSGTVTLRLDSPPAASVTWYVDYQPANGTASQPGEFQWTTDSVVNGTHQLLAVVTVEGQAPVELRQAVTVRNPEITIQYQALRTASGVQIDVAAVSPYGIRSVAVWFDGAPVATLTAPNRCSQPCFVALPYRFELARSLSSGIYAYEIVAEDLAGSTRKAAGSLVVANPPILTLSEPADRIVVDRELVLEGQVTSDQTGELRVEARFGAYRFMQTSSRNFRASLDTAGLAEGEYVLEVSVVDSASQRTSAARRVIVNHPEAASETVRIERLITLPKDAARIWADSSQLLYADSTGAVWLWPFTQDAPVQLSGAGRNTHSEWRAAHSGVVALGRGTDCSGRQCVYLWSRDGSVRNLSLEYLSQADAATRAAWSGDRRPDITQDHVAWELRISNLPFGEGRYAVLQLSSGSFKTLQGPGYYGIGTPPELLRAFESEGGLRVWLAQNLVWDVNECVPAGQLGSVYRLTPTTGESVRIATIAGCVFSLTPSASGAVWSGSGPRGVFPGYESSPLYAYRSFDDSVVAISLAATAWRSDGAMAAFNERLPDAAPTFKLSVWQAGEILGVTSHATVRPVGVLGPTLIYQQDGRLWAWRASDGSAEKVLDRIPDVWVVDAGGLVFAENGALWRLSLVP